MPQAYPKPHQQADEEEVEEIKGKDGEPRTWVFKPRAFNIVWGRDERYWVVPPKGREDAPAELVQVSWLEVTASTKYKLLPGKSYEISFDLSMSQGAFGWKDCPVAIMAKVGRGGRYKKRRIKLPSPEGTTARSTDPSVDGLTVEVPSSANCDDLKLYFGLYEVWTGRWKGGLRIHRARVVEKSST